MDIVPDTTDVIVNNLDFDDEGVILEMEEVSKLIRRFSWLILYRPL